MHSLRAFWNLLLPWQSVAFGLYVLSAAVIIGLAIANWNAPAPLQRRFAIMLLATVLAAPHLTVYDLVILAPAFLWIADSLAVDCSPRLAWLLYLSFLLPFAGPLAIYTHVQLSVICLAALTVTFAEKTAREEVTKRVEKNAFADLTAAPSVAKTVIESEALIAAVNRSRH